MLSAVVHYDSGSGSTTLTLPEPREIDLHLKEVVAKALKDKKVEFGVRTVGGATPGEVNTVLLESTQVKLRDKKGTRVKSTFSDAVKFLVTPGHDTAFSISFDPKVTIEVAATSFEERDIILLAARSFCLLYIRGQKAKKK